MKLSFLNFKKDSLIKIIIGIFFLAGFYVYTSPYLALFFLKESIENKNINQAKKYINFVALQNDLENQIMSTYKANIFNESKETYIPKIGLVILDPLMRSVINSIVSATVTTEGLELLITKGELSGPSVKTNSKLSKQNSQTGNPSINLYYQSFNTFILSSEISEIDEPIKFRFAREGVAHWRLIAVKIPIDQLSKQFMKQ